MDKLIFATGNKGKLEEAEAILGVKLKGTQLKIDEIQSIDGVEVAKRKAQDYFKILNKPLFVEDSIASFEYIDPLPGPYIKDFYEVLGNERLCELLDGKSRKVTNKVIIVFIDKNKREFVFTGETKGTISKKPRGEKGWGWDPIFIPEGSNKTFGEMEMAQKNKYSARQKAFLEFKNWLQKQDK